MVTFKKCHYTSQLSNQMSFDSISLEVLNGSSGIHSLEDVSRHHNCDLEIKIVS